MGSLHFLLFLSISSIRHSMAAWEDLGGCVDVSQSLVDGQEYIVFAEEYGEDSYIITENEDGGICVE